MLKMFLKLPENTSAITVALGTWFEKAGKSRKTSTLPCLKLFVGQ